MEPVAIEVSIILPCLNEESTLGLCIDAAHRVLSAHHLTGEVIVADNGSEDCSREIAIEKGARVIEVPVRGYGNALRAGLENAQGRYLVFLDADMSYDFEDVPRFVEQLKQGADLVIGSRFKGGIEPNAMPYSHRVFGTPVLTKMANILFHCGISDINCGMRGLTREAYRRLNLYSEGMEFASEMMIKAAKAKFKIAEIPIVLHVDQRNVEPHLRSFRDGWRHLQLMLHYCPLWMFVVPGLAMVFAGLACLLAPFRLFALTSIIGLCSVSLGVQVLLLGFIAQGRVRATKYRELTLWTRFMVVFFRIENGMLLGFIAAVLGAILFIWGSYVTLQSTAPRPGWDLLPLNAIFLAAALVINGLEVFFVSVFMGLFGIQVAEDILGIRHR